MNEIAESITDQLKAQAINDFERAKAESDLEAWRELNENVSFKACFLRRVKEKRERIVDKLIQGVSSEEYLRLCPQIGLLDEIIMMSSVEARACLQMLQKPKEND